MYNITIMFSIVLFSSILGVVSATTDRFSGPVIVVVGTRPEAIKMAPVYKALKQANIPTVLCTTGQHTDLIDTMLTVFAITPDVQLTDMQTNRDLFDITSVVLTQATKLFKQLNPSLVLVQGDTTSAMAAALAAFYLKIPVAHVEAGLRTSNQHAPFPEELNRSIISLCAQYHFAPTEQAVHNLLKQSIKPEAIFCTGNTVIDALSDIQKQLQSGALVVSSFVRNLVEKVCHKKGKCMLLTVHRRESAETGFVSIFTAIKQALAQHPELTIIYPRHPNPAITDALEVTELAQTKNIVITEPFNYTDMVYVLNHVDAVVTDSGGLQEEAVSLHKPVLILRSETERTEGIARGLARLIGTDTKAIIHSIDTFMMTPISCKTSSVLSCVYGDGKAAEYIVSILKSTIFDKPLI